MDVSLGELQELVGCCDSWSHKELDTTERLNWTEKQNQLAQSLSEEMLASYLSLWQDS